jgi:hypothetical membrane protein
MKNRILLFCGILAPLVYVFSVVLGGAMRPGYSHAGQAVSDLIASGAPNKALLDPLFAIYNLLTIAFAFGLVQRVNENGQGEAKTAGRMGALLLATEGVFGILTLFFPEGAKGMSGAITGTGLMHIIFAGLSSVATMLAMVLLGFWFANSKRWRRLGPYSFISVAVVFLSGGLAAISVANRWPFAGLAERITIGGFLLWLFVIAFVMLANGEKNPR